MGMEATACEAIGQVNSVAVAAPASVDVVHVVRRAVESRASHKVAAGSAGYGPDMWARIMSGERGVLLERLGCLPVAVQKEIVIRWAALLGLQVERKDSAVKRIAISKLAEAAQALAEIL